MNIDDFGKFCARFDIIPGTALHKFLYRMAYQNCKDSDESAYCRNGVLVLGICLSIGDAAVSDEQVREILGELQEILDDNNIDGDDHITFGCYEQSVTAVDRFLVGLDYSILRRFAFDLQGAYPLVDDDIVIDIIRAEDAGEYELVDYEYLV
jgi:hypothetical protein